MSAEDKTPDIIFDRVNVATCGLCGCDIDVAGIEPFLQIECPDCGNLETVPGQLGPFLLLELLGTGGMGGVYKARDTALGRLVGIKVMLSSVGEDAQFIETFRREAQAAAKLNHPNIAQIYSFGQEKGQPYIVMELVSGKHFDEMVDEESSLDQGLVMQVGYDIALGLQAADEINLIHGDIKPENILLDEKMSAKLVDFGIASFTHQGAQEGIWGTPYYICPEKIRKQPVDARSDIYSLGATLYHAITKHPPFDGETPIEVVKARLNGPPLPMDRYRDNINPRVNQIISRMLQLEPVRRYPNYSSLLSDIRKSTAELGSGSRSRLIKKGKKVIISKRATSEQRPASERRPALKTKRTIVTSPSGRRPTITTTRRATSSGSAVDDSASAISKYKKQSTQVIKPEKNGKGGLVAFLIIMVVLLAGTGLGVFLYIKDKNIKAQKAYVETLTLAAHKQTGENTYAQILTVASNIAAMAESALEHKAKADAAVMLILGEPVQEKEPPPKPKTSPAPKTTTDASAIEKKADGSEMPAGMLTRAQLDAKRRGETAPPPVAPKPEAQPEPEPEPETPVEDSPIKVLAGEISSITAEIQSNAEAAQQIAITCFANKSKIDASKTSRDAANNLNLLAGDLISITTLKENSATIFTALKESAKKAETMMDEKEVEEAARLKALKEETDRRNAEIEAQRKAEEYAELVKNELELVAAARQMNEHLIMKLNFQEAASAIKSQTSDYKSKEGKEAISILLEKYEQLVKLKQFLTTNINKTPYRWGYGRGQSARDIQSANAEGLQISGISKTLSWDSVSPKLFIKIINNYLSSKTIKIRALGEGNLGAAIYCNEIANDSEAILSAAKKYAETSYDLCEDLKEQVERLLQF